MEWQRTQTDTVVPRVRLQKWCYRSGVRLIRAAPKRAMKKNTEREIELKAREKKTRGTEREASPSKD